MLRVADIVPMGELDKSIKLYKEVLEQYPVHQYETLWALNELGECYFMNRDYEQERSYFMQTLAKNPPDKYREEAERYLEAIDKPRKVSLHCAVIMIVLRDYFAIVGVQ